jgi:hypothetical protein
LPSTTRCRCRTEAELGLTPAPAARIAAEPAALLKRTPSINFRRRPQASSAERTTLGCPHRWVRLISHSLGSFGLRHRWVHLAPRVCILCCGFAGFVSILSLAEAFAPETPSVPLGFVWVPTALGSSGVSGRRVRLDSRPIGSVAPLGSFGFRRSLGSFGPLVCSRCRVRSLRWVSLDSYVAGFVRNEGTSSNLPTLGPGIAPLFSGRRAMDRRAEGQVC